MNWEKFDPYQKLDEAKTPQEMRRAIEHGQRHNALIRNLLMAGRIEGMSAEDIYTVLAYHALQGMFSSQRLVHELAALDTRIPMLMDVVDRKS